MAKFRKSILATRRYHSPDGVLTVTPSRLKHWSDTFQRFKSARIGVPISWGHDDDPENSKPIALSKRQRKDDETVGWLDSFKVSADGKTAEIVLDIPRTEDAEKVRHNLAYVSPVIFDAWKDGEGTTHRDCITHVDLVRHPVDNTQTEFVPVVACALRMGLDKGKPAIYRLAEDTEMPEDEKTNGGNSETSEPEVGNEGNRLKKVMDALAGMDIVLSDDTNEENFLEHLEQALLTVAAMSGNGGADVNTETTDLEQASPDFAAMSLKDSPEQKYLTAQHRKIVATRLGALLQTGRCTPAEFKDKEPTVKAIRLSLDKSGEPIPSNLETWIASREAVPQGTFWDPETRTRLSRLEEVPHPDLGDTVTPERAREIANEIFHRR